MKWQQQWKPGVGLRDIVQQATAALVCMDAERLEELARCCADLNRELEEIGGPADAAAELAGVSGEVRLLGRVLGETRANLNVLTRLHVLRLREIDDLHRGHGDDPVRYEVQMLENSSRPGRAAKHGDD